MRKVLVAIDITREGGNQTCMTIAKNIAATMDGELHALHVIEPVPGFVASSLPSGVLDNRRAEAAELLDEQVKGFGCAEAVIREGAAATEILDYASEIEADLIVMHSHDPGLADYILGSVAGRVVRHAHCSVHIVRRAPMDVGKF